MAIAAIILGDLVSRLPTLNDFLFPGAFYSNELSQRAAGPGLWSLYWISDSASWTIILLTINALAAFWLFLGVHTRIMTAVCTVLVWSLQVRMPLILTAGDVLLRGILVFALFLPWGARWSVDSIRGRIPVEAWGRSRLTNVATAALLLQIAMMYWFSGLAKLNVDWLQGTAVAQSLELEMYVKPAGRWLLQAPLLTTALNYAVPAVEIIGPLLMFWPLTFRWARPVMMVLMCAMHVGIWLAMSIGIFSLVAIAAWLAFVPPRWWDRLTGRSAVPSESDAVPLTTNYYAGQIACGILLGIVTLENLDNVDRPWAKFVLPDAVRPAINALMLWQEFEMFGTPPRESPWFENVGQTQNGATVDLFTGEPTVAGRKPADVYAHLPGQPWRRLYYNLLVDETIGRALTDELRAALACRLATRLNAGLNEHDPVVRARIVCHREPIGPGRGNVAPPPDLWADVPIE